jgi:hypothetical protein
MLFYTNTLQGRRNALDFIGFPNSAFRYPTSIVSGINDQCPNDAPSASPLRIITETDSISYQRMTTAEADRQEARSRSPTPPLTSVWLCDSPVGYDGGIRCDGWCSYNFIPRATVVSAICTWWSDGQTLMTLFHPRLTCSCLYPRPGTRSVLGKVRGVRSLLCYATSSVSAPYLLKYGLLCVINPADI